MPEWEVACAVEADNLNDVGDVITARVPTGIVGNKEKGRFLWFTINTELSREALMTPGKAGKDRTMFCNLTDIANDEGLDLFRILDPADQYQPLLGKSCINDHRLNVKK